MRKITIVIIILMVISLGFFSGCNEQQSTNKDSEKKVETPDEVENKLPTASCSAHKTSGTPPLTVFFTGSAIDLDGTIVSYYWDFGDGEISTEQNPTHIFQNYGTYIVKLTVTDNNEGKSTEEIHIHIQTEQDLELLDWIYDSLGVIGDDVDSLSSTYSYSMMGYYGEKLNTTIAGYLYEIDQFMDLSPSYVDIKEKYRETLEDYQGAGKAAALISILLDWGDYDMIDIQTEMISIYLEDGNTNLAIVTNMIEDLV